MSANLIPHTHTEKKKLCLCSSNDYLCTDSSQLFSSICKNKYSIFQWGSMLKLCPTATVTFDFWLIKKKKKKKKSIFIKNHQFALFLRNNIHGFSRRVFLRLKQVFWGCTHFEFSINSKRKTFGRIPSSGHFIKVCCHMAQWY
jgi:hypothetical protein